MHELWDGYPHWSEEQEQADEDRRALRIMACRRKGCRRMRTCLADPPSKLACAGPLVPKTDEEWALLKAVLYHMLKRSVAEDEGDPEAARIAQEARAAAQARRRALAWERAKESIARG